MNDLTIFTGATADHFGCLRALLWTIARHEPGSTAVALDLGLEPGQASQLADVPPFYLKAFELRPFDFSKYPPHFSMAQFAGRMAFRPTALVTGGTRFVAWLDASSQLRGPLLDIRAAAAKHGVYAPCSPGSIGRLLGPSSVAPLGARPQDLALPVRDAGTCAFDTSKPWVAALLARWAQAALDPAQVAPAGTTRADHRQDAVFAALLAQAAPGAIPGARLAGVVDKQRRGSLAEAAYRSGGVA